MKTAIITGSQGFLMSYLARELLDAGYRVIGYDNYSKYGRVTKEHDNHTNFKLIETNLATSIPDFQSYNPDVIVLGAARIGGIKLFTSEPLGLILENEQILCNSYKAILECKNKPRIIYISSSMVYEGVDAYHRDTNIWMIPTKESDLEVLPPPLSCYGAQKLMGEYYCKGIYEQYGFTYTIIRPFNGCGIGENDYADGLSHVLPNLVHRAITSPSSFYIFGRGNQVRCLTHGKDIARGVRLAIESPKAINEVFNISHPNQTKIGELAKLLWSKVNPSLPFKCDFRPSSQYDVQMRVPNVEKAKRLLGFEARIGLEETVDEVIGWIRSRM